MSRPALGSTQPPVQYVLGLFPRDSGGFYMYPATVCVYVVCVCVLCVDL
jgi:hypothetical protein